MHVNYPESIQLLPGSFYSIAFLLFFANHESFFQLDYEYQKSRLLREGIV
jgi:hypothetical protein